MHDAHLWPGLNDVDYIPRRGILTKAMLNAISYHTDYAYTIPSVESTTYTAKTPELMYSERLAWEKLVWKLTVKYSHIKCMWGVLVDIELRYPRKEYTHFCSSYAELYSILTMSAQHHSFQYAE